MSRNGETGQATDQTILTRLLAAGYEPTLIAQVAEVPLDDILSMMPDRRELAAADAEIQANLRRLAQRTIEEAFHILDEGSYANKMKLVMKFGGDMLRILGHGDRDEMAELRDEFQTMMNEIRGAE